MSGFIQGQARNQSALFPEYLDDFVAEEAARQHKWRFKQRRRWDKSKWKR